MKIHLYFAKNLLEIQKLAQNIDDLTIIGKFQLYKTDNYPL